MTDVDRSKVLNLGRVVTMLSEYNEATAEEKLIFTAMMLHSVTHVYNSLGVLTPEQIKECLDLADEWAAQQNSNYDNIKEQLTVRLKALGVK